MADPHACGEAGLLAEWLSERELTGLRVAVAGPRGLRRAVRDHGGALVALDLALEPVDLLLVAGMDAGYARPSWYHAGTLRPGGLLVLVARLGSAANLGEAVAALLVGGLRCHSFEELYEPGGSSDGLRFLRLVQHRPADDPTVAP
jgi:hypothetical protein